MPPLFHASPPRHSISFAAEHESAVDREAHDQNHNMIVPSSPPSKNIFKRFDSLPSPIPAPKPLMMLRRHVSMPPEKWRMSLSAGYAGPPPILKDGSHLKSCFRSRCASCSITSLESDDFTPPHRRHKVVFTHVSVREYSLECGDNPSVTSGPPLTLGWKYNTHDTLDIDTFEADKKCVSGGVCKRLSADEREHMLLTIGRHSHRSIMNAQFEAFVTCKERLETITQLGGLEKAKHMRTRERVLIIKESASRKLERACKGTSSAKEQRKLWQNAQVTGQMKL